MNATRRATALRRLVLLAALMALAGFSAGPAPNDPASRAGELVARMTLEEKIGQLVQYSGFGPERQAALAAGGIGSLLNVTGAAETNRVQRLAVEGSRLRVPLLFGYDVIHGYRTIFPIPLAEVASWDPELAEATARVAAVEAAAAGIRWTFAPMVDIARDPRWGRIAEGAGEDPWLGAVFAAARVRGFQGRDLADPASLLACVKHYVAYGAAEAGRDYNTADISEKTLREIYLPPFRAGIEAGAGSVMSAFNVLNGVPATANRLTLEKILRQEWGYEGFVVSDWNSVGELVPHGVAADLAEAARQALAAGVDMDMEGHAYAQHLARLVREGRVAEEAVTRAARRILRAKFALGLFENPYTDPAREAQVTLTPAHRELARRAAQRSLVLLKNDPGLLPLERGAGTMAVIGPLAASRKDPLGSWFAQGQPEEVVTLLEGIRAKLGPGVRLLHAEGATLAGGSAAQLAEAVALARQADVVLLALGEGGEMSGEAASRAYLDLPGNQDALLRAVVATGKPVVLVLFAGRPLAIPWAAENVPAILLAWFPGVESGHAIADALFGDVNPGGRLPVTFPRAVGQIPIYYNRLPTGRPAGPEKYTSKYLDVPVEPQYVFGHGLSYTTFRYTDLRLESPRIAPTSELRVSVAVTNTGRREGDEVVQLYVRQLVGSTSRPLRELKAFRRITLLPGQTHRVEFRVPARELGSWNPEMRYAVEPGAYRVYVGPNSAEGLEAGFEIR